jgi:hypothetical protein
MWKFCYPVQKLKTEGLLSENQMKQIFNDIFEQISIGIKKKMLELQENRKLELEKVNQKLMEKNKARQKFYNDIAFLFSNRLY